MSKTAEPAGIAVSVPLGSLPADLRALIATSVPDSNHRLLTPLRPGGSGARRATPAQWLGTLAGTGAAVWLSAEWATWLIITIYPLAPLGANAASRIATQTLGTSTELLAARRVLGSAELDAHAARLDTLITRGAHGVQFGIPEIAATWSSLQPRVIDAVDAHLAIPREGEASKISPFRAQFAAARACPALRAAPAGLQERLDTLAAALADPEIERTSNTEDVVDTMRADLLRAMRVLGELTPGALGQPLASDRTPLEEFAELVEVLEPTASRIAAQGEIDRAEELSFLRSLNHQRHTNSALHLDR